MSRQPKWSVRGSREVVYVDLFMTTVIIFLPHCLIYILYPPHIDACGYVCACEGGLGAVSQM